MKYVVSALLAVVVLGLSGCNWQTASFKATRSVSLAHVAAEGVDVQTGNGHVTVATGGTEAVVVANLRAISRERLDAARVDLARTGDGTLVVRVSWPDGKRLSNEGCDLDITLPDADGVKAQTSNGRITLTGLAGAAELRSSNGRITVNGHNGPVTAKTSNGAVVLTDVGAADARSSNGAITVVLAAGAPGPLTAHTSNGDITATVDAGFDGTLEASTSNGSVTNSVAGGKAVGAASRKSGTFQFGAGKHKGVLETSNGKVRIVGRG